MLTFGKKRKGNRTDCGEMVGRSAGRGETWIAAEGDFEVSRRAVGAGVLGEIFLASGYGEAGILGS